MTVPGIRENEATQSAWNRKARDAINAISARLTGSGATASRPAAPTVGQMFYDTTLGIPIWYHATAVWKNAAGTTV
jgi:hypothetical protein